MRLLTMLLGLAVLLSSTPAAAQELPNAAQLGQLLGFVRWGGVFMSLFVVVGANAFLSFVGGSATRLSARFTKRRLAIQKVESVARFGIYATTALFVVALSFQINDQTLKVIGAGIVVGVGFGTRDLLAAVAAGIIIMFDRPFQVGDRVNYAGEYGDIVQIGLRSVRMRTLDDALVTIPNNKFLTDVTSSGNHGTLDMHVAMEFYVGADQDLELAERLLQEAMLTSRYVYLGKPAVVLIRQTIVADMVVIELRGKAYVLDTRYEKAFETDVSKRTLGAFRRYGVLPPAAFERPQVPEQGLA
jgi:small-conductance mechanosensitive channel